MTVLLRDLHFFYVGASEETDTRALRRSRRSYLSRFDVIQCRRRELDEPPTLEVEELFPCANLLEAYGAERESIRWLRSHWGDTLLNRNMGGRVRLGEWCFKLGTEQVIGFLALSLHAANVLGLDPQTLKYRIEELGWTLPRALWSPRQAGNTPRGKRGVAKTIAELRRSPEFAAFKRRISRRLAARGLACATCRANKI